ncbi:MAG TPA: metabolite traffic protein EboE [Polyangiaceae bacterium]|nr:metabolite traffic protein EboE [Polyangiaceae bacterium]
MRVLEPRGAHLGYCTNIHAGESLADVRSMLGSLVPEVKRRVSPRADFGVGLRLAAQAASELDAPAELEAMSELLEREGLYVFSLNGFPYGAFHATRVKERVYLPDWLEERRVSYTRSLAAVLAALLPEGVEGSISTVPGAFAPRAAARDAGRRLALNLVRAAADLLRLERETGKHIVLALEPEPACFLETSAQAVRFFEDELFSDEALAAFAGVTGLSGDQAEGSLRRHVGICLDACHGSVEFERPVDALATFVAAGVAVPKIQISNALKLSAPNADSLAALREFDDGVYLHQTVVKSAGGTLTHYVDLPDALAAAGDHGAGSEWRVHFHVPVFESRLGPFTSTQDELGELLIEAPALPAHLEVETYTFDVLPAEYRQESVTEAVSRELAWTLGMLARRSSRNDG